MGLVADEYAAVDSYYYFKEPLFYRYPENTDEIFQAYVNNPEDFEEFEIPNDYLGQRYHDLDNDLRDLKYQAYTYENSFKIQYYRGCVLTLKWLYFKNTDLAQSDIAIEYNSVRREISKIRESSTRNITGYCFHKGKLDILKQILLNTPLMKKQ
jgi:hypothetical protein